MAEFFEVGKLEGARRHIEAGIELFFERKDPVVVYSVAWSAYGVLSEICKARGITRDFEDAEFFAQLPEKERSKLLAEIKRPRNFFQHGERGKETIKFYPESVPVFLLLAHFLYTRLTQETLLAGKVLRLWFAVRYGKDRPEAAAPFGTDISHFPSDDYNLYLCVIRGTPPAD